MQKPKISIITPAFNEEKSLPAYVQTVKRVLLARTDYDFEIVFVDDGSGDATWPMIREICAADARFRGLRLSRNFGPNIADSAGIAAATGDAVAILSCDLQDPPEVILEFLEKWKNGAKVVWGKRRSRKDPLWRRIVSWGFNRLLRMMVFEENSKFTSGGFIMMDRQVVECFKQFPERNRVVFGLVAWTGFDQAVVDYDRVQRVSGKSGWSIFRMIHTLYDALVGFSPRPIRVITFIGLSAFLLSIPLAIYLIYCKLAGLQSHLGWTGLMLAVDISFGVQCLLTGIMGEYLYRIYTEVTRRPLYFVSENTSENKQR